VVSPAYISDALATVIDSVIFLVCPVSRESLLRSNNLCQHQIYLASYPHDQSPAIFKDYHLESVRKIYTIEDPSTVHDAASFGEWFAAFRKIVVSEYPGPGSPTFATVITNSYTIMQNIYVGMPVQCTSL